MVMYCPKCSTQNLAEAQFCRSCGANLSLIPQALAGQLPKSAPMVPLAPMASMMALPSDNNISGALRSIFMGLGFIIVSLILSRQGQGWWFWMLLPALAMIGKGVGDYVQARTAVQRILPPAPVPTVLPPAAPRPMFGNPVGNSGFNTGEIRPPQNYSVTENTTRHLPQDTARHWPETDVEPR